MEPVQTQIKKTSKWGRGTYRIVDAGLLEQLTSEGWRLVRLLRTTATDHDKDGPIETLTDHRFLLRLDEASTLRRWAKRCLAAEEKLAKAEENLNMALKRSRPKQDF